MSRLVRSFGTLFRRYALGHRIGQGAIGVIDVGSSCGLFEPWR